MSEWSTPSNNAHRTPLELSFKMETLFNVHSQFEKFINEFTNTLDNHAPKTKSSRKELKMKSKQA